MGVAGMEGFPESSSALRMLGYVSTSFYEGSYVGKWLYQVMGLEYDEAFKMAEHLPEQFFPETATWGLRYHEGKWGLPARETLGYLERRRLVYQKRDYCAPMSPYHMEVYLRNATGFEVHISDCHDPGDDGYQPAHPNTFRAVFEGEGTLDTGRAKALLKNIKQSHTTFAIFDKVTGIIDCRGLGQVYLRGLSIRTGLPFWGQRVFDGSWLLDGAVPLDTTRRYGLLFGVEYSCGVLYGLAGAYTWLFDGTWAFDGSARLDSRRRAGLLGIYIKIHRLETAARAAIQARYQLDFWRHLYGGRHLAAASVQVHMKIYGPAGAIQGMPVDMGSGFGNAASITAGGQNGDGCNAQDGGDTVASNVLITKKARENLVKARAGAAALPPIAGMAFGDGGCSAGGEAAAPEENQAALRHELYRKQVDGYEFTGDTVCRYKCTLSETELAGAAINEVGLYDTEGDLVCIKTFRTKNKDDDLQMAFTLDDIF